MELKGVMQVISPRGEDTRIHSMELKALRALAQADLASLPESIQWN